MSVSIVRTVADLREVVGEWRALGLKVGVVPTMGALHEGHLSLVRAAFKRADRVIVTLFVNPTQFDNATDLGAYPRTEETDAAKLASVKADVLFAPDVSEMYPSGFATSISVRGVSEGLCGTYRPGHFDGVATVVAKLLLQTTADLAFFGEKDFQQLQVVRRLVRDLDIHTEIVGCPTIREPDGLAMSSRNIRLTADQRQVAPHLAEVLFSAAEKLAIGERAQRVLATSREALLSAGFERVEYLELRSADGLLPLETASEPARLLAAAWLGGVRLIDNVSVGVCAGSASTGRADDADG
ncbi:MAG: pantoate--beta-alanine ligase [Rhizobiaceae bacterium]|nr:pantoate--beta-alanine ligase [Rhizobiaceae bacterium]